MEAEQSGAGKPWWGVSIGQIAERVGKSVNEIGPQLDSLADDGYVSVKCNTPTSGHPHRHMGVRLLPEGRKALGGDLHRWMQVIGHDGRSQTSIRSGGGSQYGTASQFR